VSWQLVFYPFTGSDTPQCQVNWNGSLFIIYIRRQAVPTLNSSFTVHPFSTSDRGATLNGGFDIFAPNSDVYTPAFVYDACLNSTLNVFVRESIFNPYDPSPPGRTESDPRFRLALGRPITVGVVVSFNPIYIRRDIVTAVSIVPTPDPCDGGPGTTQPPTVVATPASLPIGRNCSNVPATPVPLSAAVSLASTGPGSTLAGLDIVCPGCTAGKGLLCLMAHCQQPLLHCGGPRVERCSMYSRLKRLCLFLPAGSGLPVLTVPLIKGYDVSSPVYWSPVDQFSNPGLVCRSRATNFIILAAEGDAISQDAQALFTHAFSALRLRSAARQATVEEYAACLSQVLMVLRDDGPAATKSFDLLFAAISGPLSAPTAISRVESSVTYLVQDCGIAPPGSLPSGEYLSTTRFWSSLHASRENLQARPTALLKLRSPYNAVAAQPPLLVRAFCNVPSSESIEQEYPTFRDILTPFVVLTATDFQLQARCDGCAGTSSSLRRVPLGCATSLWHETAHQDRILRYNLLPAFALQLLDSQLVTHMPMAFTRTYAHWCGGTCVALR